MYEGIVNCELFRVLGKYTIFLGESMPMLSRLIHQSPHIDLHYFAINGVLYFPLFNISNFPYLYMRARFCGMSMLPLGSGIILVWTCIYFGSRVRSFLFHYSGYISSGKFLWEAGLCCELVYELCVSVYLFNAMALHFWLEMEA